MTKSVLVVVERRGTGPVRGSLEALGVARRIAGPPGNGLVTALLVGSTLEASATQVASLGVDKVLTISDPRFDAFQAAVWASAIATVAQESGSGVVLVAGTSHGRQLVGRLAARWNAIAVNGVSDITTKPDGSLSVTRPIFSGRAIQEVHATGPRAVLGLRSNAFLSLIHI